MKKLTAILLCLALLLASGCGSGTQPRETEPAETTAPETTQTTAAETTVPETTEAVDQDPDGPTNGRFFHYSYGLNDEGYMDGIKALDYVDLSDLEELLVFKSADIVPDDEIIDDEVKNFCSLFMEQTTDRAIEDGDQVNIDYVGRVDGVAFEGGNTNGSGATVTAGSTQYIDDFLTQIIGHKPGETFDVNVTFPDPYQQNEDLSGKDAVFEVTVNYIDVIPELTDELIEAHQEELGEFFPGEEIATAEDLREYFTDWYYLNNLLSATENVFMNDVKISEVPEKALEITYSAQKIMFCNYYGMTVEDMVENYDYDEEEIKKTLNIEGAAKTEMVYQAIAEQLDLHMTDDDYKEATGQEVTDEMIDFYGRGYLAQYAMKTRIADYLKETAVVED